MRNRSTLIIIILMIMTIIPGFCLGSGGGFWPPGPTTVLPNGSGGYKIGGVPIAFGWAPRHSDSTARDAYWDSSTTARTPVNDSSICITNGQLQGYTGSAWVDASGWITGPQGDAGDPGTAGADGADGVGTAWETDHTYTADDIVANGGTWYSCTSGHASASATEPGTGVSWETVWELITGSGGTDDQTAAEVPITDAANIITATDTEGALGENRGAIDLLESSVSEHTSSVDNPHSVTYAQAGAIEDDDDTVGAGHLDWGTGPNQISAADVPIADASDRYTSTELESALIDEAASENGSGPNASNGKIHWTQLLGVPTGFADGTDDGGSYPGVTTDGSNGLTITGDVGAVDGNFSGSVTIGVNDALDDSDIGSSVQAYDADLDDLADGTLTGSKLGECSNSKGALPTTSGITDGYVPKKQTDGSVAWEADSTGAGGDQLVDIVTTPPLTVNAGANLDNVLPGSDADVTFAIADAVADGSTKGAASFAANDFDSSSGNISIDYTNGQKADTDNPGFLTDTDWDTFNNKIGSTGVTYENLNTNSYIDTDLTDGATASTVPSSEAVVSRLATIDYWPSLSDTDGECLSSAPGSPTAGTVYCANCDDWDPLSRTGTANYLVVYNGADYVGIVDEDGIWLIDTIDLGGGDFEIPNISTGDTTVTEGQVRQKSHEDAIALHGGSTGEIQDEFLISGLVHIVIPFDPEWWYDNTDNHIIPLPSMGNDFPSGGTLVEWSVTYINGDPTTELDADLMTDTDYDPSSGGTVMDVLDTTAGASSADSGFDSATAANGNTMYIRFGADPTDSGEPVLLEYWMYAEED